MNNPVLKPRLEDYTESEFLQLLGMIDAALNQGREKEADDLVEHFQRIAGHPGGSDLLFWPKPGQDDSDEGVMREIKRWRAEQGLPGFKQ